MSSEQMPKEQTVPNHSSEQRPDVDAIMSRIRAEVKQDLGAARERFPRPPSAAMGPVDSASSPVLYAEELNFMNAEWRGWAVRPEVSTHRKHVGKLIVRFKQYLVHLIWDIFFPEYFRREELFHRNLIRYLNKEARYIDARDAEVFWQLVQKIDNDIATMNDKCDRLYDEVFASLAVIEERLDALNATQEERRVGEQG